MLVVRKKRENVRRRKRVRRKGKDRNAMNGRGADDESDGIRRYGRQRPLGKKKVSN